MITIYGLVDPREPQRVRYVGQTKHPEIRLRQHRLAIGVSAKCEWVASLKAYGVRPDLIVLTEVGDDLANAAELRWTNSFASDELFNSGSYPVNRTTYGKSSPVKPPSRALSYDLPDEMWRAFLQTALLPA